MCPKTFWLLAYGALGLILFISVAVIHFWHERDLRRIWSERDEKIRLMK